MTTIQFILAYLAIINIITCVVFGIDKHKAVNHEFRIPEATLFLLAILGGSVGALVGMFSFHHKTRKWKFRVFIPLIMVCEALLLCYLLSQYNVYIR